MAMGATMSEVRDLQPSDVPQVARLRERVFAETRFESLGALERHIERVFLHNPWRGDGAPSLVHVGPGGEINGFLGLVPRPLAMGTQAVRGVVAAQFMVAPEARGLPGVRLYQVGFARPADLLYTDVGTPDATALWELMGGRAALIYGMTWTCPVRPGEYAASSGSPRLWARGVRYGMRAGLRFLDRVTPRVPSVLRNAPAARPATPAEAIALVEELSGNQLRAVYDLASFGWVCATLQIRWGANAVHLAAVPDDDGRSAGWFLYGLPPRGTAVLYQLIARRDRYERVLAAALRHAYDRGAIAVQGRFDRRYAHLVRRFGGTAAYHGRGILARTTDAVIMQQLLSGEARLSGLDGEWPLGF